MPQEFAIPATNVRDIAGCQTLQAFVALLQILHYIVLPWFTRAPNAIISLDNLRYVEFGEIW